MSPQQRLEFVRENLYKQMQAAKNGSAKHFARLNRELANNDKIWWTLLKQKTIKVHNQNKTFYGLYVLQNKKQFQLSKLITL